MDMSTWEPWRLVALGAVSLAIAEVAVYFLWCAASSLIGHRDGPTPKMGG